MNRKISHNKKASVPEMDRMDTDSILDQVFKVEWVETIREAHIFKDTLRPSDWMVTKHNIELILKIIQLSSPHYKKIICREMNKTMSGQISYT